MSKEALGRKLLTAMCTACALIAFAAVPSGASALPFTVNDTGDGTDVTPGNSVCETGTGNGICTLRAAIGEANALAGTDSIGFSSGVFNGTAATSTISIATALPLITTQIFIDGGSCVTGGGDPKPCTAVNANNGGSPRDIDAFVLFGSGASGSSIKRFAIFGAQRGIVSSGTGPLDTSNTISVEGNWFGSNLNGSPASTADANSTGVDAAGNSWDIGGTTAQERNVFRPNFTEIRIVGGDNNVVAGNYFGVNAAGTLDTSLNSVGVRIHSHSSVGDGVATGNVIGGSDVATPGVCDGSCNVMAQAGSAGNINLGTFSGFNPAGLTTINGNFIGLQANGAQASASITIGIDVGDADDVTIGGSSVDDRNFIGGGAIGITTGAAADGLIVRNNFIGVEPDGTGEVAPMEAGVEITASIGADADRPQILDNTIVGDSTADQDGLRLFGGRGLVQGNQLGRDAAGTARPIGDDAVEITGTNYLLISNSVSNGRSTGVNINGAGAAGNILNGNTIFSNGVGAGGPGLRIQNGASQNILGNQPFTTPGNINIFAANAGDAIELLGDGTDDNLLIGNLTGANNSGGADQFVDLGGDGLGNNVVTGPNAGVQAPTISFAGAGQATGTATPNALVVLYTAEGTHPDAILANGMADGSGNWSINYPAIPLGTKVFANQTPATTSNTSELAGPVLAANPPLPPPAGGGSTTTTPTPQATGQRAAALKKCKKKKSARARRNCKKRANKLPV